MKELEMKERVQTALNAQLSFLCTSPSQREQLIETAMEGRKVKKTKLSFALILAMILCLLTAGALAAVLLSGQEIVEKLAVPMAQSSKHENYTHEELQELMTALNENGITLDEGSTLMQAFRTGHGYWERDTIEEICRAAFGGRENGWTVEQKHWYGEMMVSIGAWDNNYYLLPGEDDMTVEEARALAARLLNEAYGADLPKESDDQWRIDEVFNRVCVYDENGQESWEDQWSFWFVNRRTDNVDYDVTFDRDGGEQETWRAHYLEEINTKNWAVAMDDLTDREGNCTGWGVETWAEFGDLIQGTDPKGRNGWLYQHAGYRLPPKGAITPEQAKEIALKEMDYGEITGKVYDHVICCTDGDRPIYKVNHRVIFNAEDLDRGGRYDAVWCLEVDCMTGKVLDKREFVTGPAGDFMMMYVPFSLLEEAPAADNENPAVSQAEQRVMELAKKEEEAMKEYGNNLYFWPPEVQQAVYGGAQSVPTQEEYDRALKIAMDAIAAQYGPDALKELGDYQVGMLHRRFDDEKENGCRQLDWDFMFTTDPEFLSDGYRVQFIQLIYAKDDLETVRDLIVEHANMGNG